ncbi:hypothetical protein [Paenibacillus silvae]|uniref:Uncharacterized protein n=1 Tax=Paenibacillus silvae TaxID=1325358 RepID=A0A2W6P816_9BACL|nr:hypothetical protein [Paenibacillus silvae]PZT54316.1 hypothetical protein DN757_17445 [Paenibacillus silvae]
MDAISSIGHHGRRDEQFIEDFYIVNPDIEVSIKATHEFVKEHEFVRTMYGRNRRSLGHKPNAIAYNRLVLQICAITVMNKVPLDFWKIDKIPYKLKCGFQDIKKKGRMCSSYGCQCQDSRYSGGHYETCTLHEFVMSKGWYTAGTVHDEALLQVERKIKREEIAAIKACMTNAAILDVPLKLMLNLCNEGVKKLSRKINLERLM